jgi:hypothetical protein
VIDQFLTRCLKHNETVCTAISELFATWMYFLMADNPPNFTDRNTQIRIHRDFLPGVELRTADTTSRG